MVSPIDYDLVREHPRRFLLAAGHVDAKAAHGRILEAENGYAIIERVGGPGRG